MIVKAFERDGGAGGKKTSACGGVIFRVGAEKEKPQS